VNGDESFPIQARGVAIDVVGVPDEIQYMPGGISKLNATKGGKAFSCVVNVVPDTARVLQASLLKWRQVKAPQIPYFDANHKSEAAMMYPERFMWKDTPEPGVYVAVSWSKVGADLVSGRAYRAFSPSFFIDAANPANVTGMDFIGGSLTCSPAFSRIKPLWCSDVRLPRVGEHVDIPGVIGNACRVERKLGDGTYRLRTRLGEAVFCSAARLREIVEGGE
jgi:hypothetical protein